MKDQCIHEKLEPSKEVVRKLRAEHISLAAPLPIEQVFYGGSDALRQVEAELAKQGYRRTHIDENSVGMTVEEVSDEAWVERTIPKMCELAEQTGAEYDGWSVDVSSQTVK